MNKRSIFLQLAVILGLVFTFMLSASFATTLQNKVLSAFTWQNKPNLPNGIILFIGDGMGEGHLTAARWYSSGKSGQLIMDQLPYSGWANTASAASLFTDSAAAATALATGTRTFNGYVAMDTEKNNLETILEQAQDQGKAVGLISTTNMSHATPASFAAHVLSRQSYEEIAAQIYDHKLNVILGGGEDDFLPLTETGCFPRHGWRMDGRNLIQEAVDAGYTYVCNSSDLQSVNPVDTTSLLGLFSDKGMVREYDPSLAQMTTKAIEVLSQDPDGFFLMVEGGQIDWAAHDNFALEVITDVLGLDEAVGIALSYAEQTERSLVIVTADHETGGMSVSLESSGKKNEDGPFEMPDSTPFFVNWTSANHTTADVPVFSFGYLADTLTGTFENTFIYKVMFNALVEAEATTEKEK